MHLGEQERFCMQMLDFFSLQETHNGCKQMSSQDFVVFTAAATVTVFKPISLPLGKKWLKPLAANPASVFKWVLYSLLG